MADLVNDTAKKNLGVKNQEPTHLKMATHDDLGGTTIDAQPNSVKIDAGKGVKGRDTTVKGAGQNSEPTHLKTVNNAPPSKDVDDVAVDFGESDKTADAIDEALDAFEEVELEIGGDDDDDDDKKDDKDGKKPNPFDKDVKEDTSFDLSSGEVSAVSDNNAKMAATQKPVKDAVNSGPNKETGNNAVNEEDETELPPWLQKKKSGDDDKKDVKESEEIVIKTDGDDDKKDDKSKDAVKSGGDKDGGKANPFDKNDGSKGVVGESVKIRIKLPKSNLFESVGLTPKAQKQMGVLFESALKDVTVQVSKQLHKHYKALHESKIAKRDVVMAQKMDQYLDYVVEEFMKQNRVTVRRSLRTQLAEEFLNRLQGLFKEYYIDIPEAKVDIVKQLTAQNAQLKATVNEEHKKMLQVRSLAESANKKRIVAEYVLEAKMSVAQCAKFMKLAESVKYTKAKDFREKLDMLKESYFGEDGKKKLTESLVEVEDKDAKVLLTNEGTSTIKTSGDPDIDAIAATISRQAKAAQEWQ